jgi:hypothetical protein
VNEKPNCAPVGAFLVRTGAHLVTGLQRTSCRTGVLALTSRQLCARNLFSGEASEDDAAHGFDQLGLRREQQEAMRVLTGIDINEGLAAFRERRVPNFAR